MKKYKIFPYGDLWELHDGTMLENGDPHPLICREDKNKLIFAAGVLLADKQGSLYIFNKNGMVETKINLPY